MTLEQFVEVTKARIPTPAEFVSLAEDRGYGFKIDGERAALLARAGDKLAVALAKMLGREPYRTNVLGLLRARMPSPLREWLWRTGHRYTEYPGDGDASWHPTGAFWWRTQGETKWRPVPGRNERGYPIPQGEEVLI